VTNEMILLDEGAQSLGIKLDDAQLQKFSTLMMELAKWSQKINLTAIKGFKDIAVKHLLDSLTLPAQISLSGSLLDIGSGAGFPAIPISIIRPELEVVSVDAVQKKIMFQKHIARTLDLDNLNAVHARAEFLFSGTGKRFDFIVSRAFSSLKIFAELSLPLLADEGKAVAMKGLDGRREALDVEAELAASMMQIERIIEFTLPVSGDSRSLIVISRRK
jgi:16S rRNA (guanine527-N7)-methyltransferase